MIYEDKTKQVKDLEAAMKKFLENGGKIEKLPPCMTSEEYYANKKRLKRKKAKTK